MKKLHRIVITTGDIDGIGMEIASKALSKIKPKKGIRFYLWRSPKAREKHLKNLDRFFSRHTFNNWNSALKFQGDCYKNLIDIESPASPTKWVEFSAKSALKHSVDALVTGPLSKTEMIQSGFKDMGHTGLLKRITGVKNLFMAFVGKKFNTVLLTDHLSVKKAYDKIDGNLLEECIELTHHFKKNLGISQRRKPLGIVALNPHAGEKGVIDKKEENIFKPLLKKMRKRKILLSSILVPDVCFQKKFWKNYSFYITNYHDQGLIPFKMAHSHHPGAQISLGLPFLRTSVDHGTAKDIFNKNMADSRSMEYAIKIAIKILRKQPILR